MAPCPIFAGLDHGILVNGAKCPACGSIDAGSSTSSSQSTSISSTQASSESSAVTYPGPSLAVATTLRQQSINYGNISKQRGGQAKAATPPALPPVYKFNIRVAAGMEEEWLRNLRAEDDAMPEDPTPVPDDPLEEIGEILASMSKGKEKAHKRTISEVIPREEREVEREKDTAQVNAQVNGDSEVNEIAQIDKDNAPSGLRRSGRSKRR